MQRSISNKNSVTPFIYVVLFFIYTALSGIYQVIPPLFAVLFILFSRALKHEDTFFLFLISFCLLFFEAENGYVLFSTIIYFVIIYKYVIPKITQNFSCNSCIKITTVLVIYLGFFVFHSIMSNIFLLPMPSMNYYVIYYIIIEFFIVSIL